MIVSWSLFTARKERKMSLQTDVKIGLKDVLPVGSRIKIVSCVSESGVYSKPEEDFNCFQPLDQENNKTCEASGCQKEIFAACSKCSSLLCFEHFDKNESCNGHLKSINKFKNVAEVFENNEEEQAKSNRSVKNKNITRKFTSEGRVKGLGYIRRRRRCNEVWCKQMKYQCSEIGDGRRREILNAFRSLKNLKEQRNFLLKSLTVTANHVKTSRRSRTIHYFLYSKNGTKLSVCRSFFLSTLNISERLVRTTLEKAGW